MYAGAPAGVKSKVKRCLGAVTCLSSTEEDYDCFPLEQECLEGEAVEEELLEGATMSRIARLECQIELILCRDGGARQIVEWIRGCTKIILPGCVKLVEKICDLFT